MADLSQISEKFCGSCGETRLLEQFRESRAAKSSYTLVCKKCEASRPPAIAGVYKWVNQVTQRALVGQSTNFRSRKSNYLTGKKGLRAGGYPNAHFQNSFNKHGEANFRFEIIEEVPQNDLSDEQHATMLTAREQFWVDHYREMPEGVFNDVGPVNATRRGSEQTTAAREKISIGHKGRKYRPWSQEAKDRVSRERSGSGNLNFGGPLRETHRANIGKALTGIERRNSWRPIERIDCVTGEVKEYESAKFAAAEGFRSSGISSACVGRIALHKGFFWQYSEQVKAEKT